MNEEQRDEIARVLAAHAVHARASGNLWSASCLAVACGWADSNRGDLSFAYRAHRQHVADVIMGLLPESYTRSESDVG